MKENFLFMKMKMKVKKKIQINQFKKINLKEENQKLEQKNLHSPN